MTCRDMVKMIPSQNKRNENTLLRFVNAYEGISEILHDFNIQTKNFSNEASSK